MKRQTKRHKSKKKQQRKRKERMAQRQQIPEMKLNTQNAVEEVVEETKISIPVKELIKHIWKDNKLVIYIKKKVRKPKELIGDQGVAETWDVVGFLVTTGCSVVTVLFIILGILAIIN